MSLLKIFGYNKKPDQNEKNLEYVKKYFAFEFEEDLPC